MLTLSPYLVFGGQAREALEFYHGVLGGSLSITTHGEYMPNSPTKDQVMHGSITTEAFTLMASDDPRGSVSPPASSIQLCLWGDDLTQGQAWFDGLSAGGKVTTELGPQMWGDHYGDLVDKFGVTWAVNVSSPG